MINKVATDLPKIMLCFRVDVLLLLASCLVLRVSRVFLQVPCWLSVFFRWVPCFQWSLLAAECGV